MGNLKGEMIITSPPYLNQRKYVSNNVLSEEAWTSLVASALGNPALVEDCQIFINLGPVHRDGEFCIYWDNLLGRLKQKGYPLYSVNIWDKKSAATGSFHGRLAPAFEFVFNFNQKPRKPNKIVRCIGAGKHIIHGTNALGRGDENRKHQRAQGRMVSEFRISDNVIRTSCAKDNRTGHPAVFPVSLAETFIASYTRRGELIYDPFAGSGTTMVASERLGRRCVAMEIEPAYCDQIVWRMQKMFVR